jgi:hypothetical protein
VTLHRHCRSNPPDIGLRPKWEHPADVRSLEGKPTSEHVNLTAFSNMQVSLAAQVLSSTIANALEYVVGESAKRTVDVICIMNKWFDIMNVKNLYEGQRSPNANLMPFMDFNNPRVLWLENDFLDYLDHWRSAANGRSGNFSAKQKQLMQLSVQMLTGFRITSQLLQLCI